MNCGIFILVENMVMVECYISGSTFVLGRRTGGTSTSFATKPTVSLIRVKRKEFKEDVLTLLILSRLSLSADFKASKTYNQRNYTSL